jgi:hypothetical protein
MRLLPARRRTRIALAVLSVAALATLAVFTYRPWEARYRGRPTSWWARKVSDLSADARPAWKQWLASARIDPDPTDDDGWGLVYGDSAAVPVLLELLRRPEVELRVLAVYGLGATGRKQPGSADAAIPALAAAFRDGSHDVRREARVALRSIAPEAAEEADTEEGVPSADDTTDRQ